MECTLPSNLYTLQPLSSQINQLPRYGLPIPMKGTAAVVDFPSGCGVGILSQYTPVKKLALSSRLYIRIACCGVKINARGISTGLGASGFPVVGARGSESFGLTCVGQGVSSAGPRIYCQGSLRVSGSLKCSSLHVMDSYDRPDFRAIGLSSAQTSPCTQQPASF